MSYRNEKLTRLAHNAPCLLRVDRVCNGDSSTTVWCHSNQGEHGKGKSLKAHDCFGAFGCSACHSWLDHGKASAADKLRVFRRAADATLLYLWQNGLIAVAGPRTAVARAPAPAPARKARADGPTARPSKILPRPYA